MKKKVIITYDSELTHPISISLKNGVGMSYLNIKDSSISCVSCGIEQFDFSYKPIKE